MISSNLIEDTNEIVSRIPDAISRFIEKLGKIHESSKAFLAGTILTRTICRRSKLEKGKLILDICLYGRESKTENGRYHPRSTDTRILPVPIQVPIRELIRAIRKLIRVIPELIRAIRELIRAIRELISLLTFIKDMYTLSERGTEFQEQKTHNVWELGCLLICIYQAVLDRAAPSAQKAVSDYIINRRDRLYLYDFPCGESFLLLIGFLMCRYVINLQ